MTFPRPRLCRSPPSRSRHLATKCASLLDDMDITSASRVSTAWPLFVANLMVSPLPASSHLGTSTLRLNLPRFATLGSRPRQLDNELSSSPTAKSLCSLTTNSDDLWVGRHDPTKRCRTMSQIGLAKSRRTIHKFGMSTNGRAILGLQPSEYRCTKPSQSAAVSPLNG